MWLVASLPVWLFALFLWFIPRPNEIFKLFLFTGVVFMGVALIVCMLIHPVLVKFQRTGLHHYLLAYVIAV